MRARYWWAAAALLGGLAAMWMVRRSYSAPPQVAFAIVKRESLVSVVTTNGKVEPFELAEVRAQRAGLVQRVLAQPGKLVKAGQLLVELDDREARAELAAAEARLRQAQAAWEVIEKGGRAVELEELESALTRARLELGKAQQDYEALRRLQQKQAATAAETEAARHRWEQARAELAGLQAKRAALVSASDRKAAQARVQEAEAARQQAAERLRQCSIQAPINGVLYDWRVRKGDYVEAGALIAAVGRLDRLRVRVYVDEPELGRLANGMPVTLTWDGLPGRTWHGRIEQMPLQVRSLGSRQVGEVLLSIENPELNLLPGANVNAEIRAQIVNKGLIIPKEAVRRMSDQAGVYLLEAGDRLRWRPIKLGSSSATRVQVLEGLAEGQQVALGSQHPLRDGLRVRPTYP